MSEAKESSGMKESSEEPSIEYSEDGEMIIHIPENAVPDETIKDKLSAIYRDADKLFLAKNWMILFNPLSCLENSRLTPLKCKQMT